MSWVIDTCILVDVLEDDPRFGAASAASIDALAGSGLVVCPVTYAELAPAFEGHRHLQDEFLAGIGVDWTVPWTWQDTLAAHGAWARFTERRRRDKLPRRPLADVLIGAFATRHEGVITRNPRDFSSVFADLAIVDPSH